VENVINYSASSGEKKTLKNVVSKYGGVTFYVKVRFLAFEVLSLSQFRKAFVCSRVQYS
jgi:hypothetical protein